jgi:hypothetical protein
MRYDGDRNASFADGWTKFVVDHNLHHLFTVAHQNLMSRSSMAPNASESMPLPLSEDVGNLGMFFACNNY